DEHWLTISSQTHPPEKSAAEVEFLVEELGLQSGQTVLDLPCGHGRHSIEFREEFDAVFNLWTSFGYFENETEDRLVLDRAFRALRPGGAFVLETVNLYAVLRRFEPRSWHELGDGRMLLEERSFDPFTARMTSGWTL